MVLAGAREVDHPTRREAAMIDSRPRKIERTCAHSARWRSVAAARSSRRTGSRGAARRLMNSMLGTVLIVSSRTKEKAGPREAPSDPATELSSRLGPSGKGLIVLALWR